MNNNVENIDELVQKGLQPLSVEAVKIAAQNDATLLDTRLPEEFTVGFIPGSISIGLDKDFAEWASLLIPADKPIVLIANAGEERDSLELLAKLAFNNFAGYLQGSFEAWQKSGEDIDIVIDVEADELAMDIPFDEKLVVIDVRKPAEFVGGHIKDALNIPLDELADPVSIASIEEDQNVYIHSGSGYRSVIAASLLKRQGVHNLRNVVGGWDKIKDEHRITKEKENTNLN
jgi:rhodanese-related sulfurtransferase